MSPEDAFSGNQDLLGLAMALNRGDVAHAAKLLDEGVDVNGRGRGGITPLLFAIINRRERAIPLLMRYGADPMAEMTGLGSPLTLSAAVPGGEVLKLLLNNGAEPGGLSSDEEPLLFYAVRAGLFENVEALLDAGADIDMRDGVGRTPLSLSIDVGAFDLAIFLLERGARPEASDHHPLQGILDWQFQPGSEPDRQRAVLIKAFAEQGQSVPPPVPMTPP